MSESEARRIAAAIGGVIAAERLPDGSWRCACGEDFPSDVELYRHRMTEHQEATDD